MQSNQRKIAIGIDLGTTNSLVAYCDNQPYIIEVNGQRLLKSIIGFNECVIIGEEALDTNRPLHSIKRLMTDYCNQKIHIGGNQYLTPIEISAVILKKLKTIAEAHLKVAINDAVITVPAHFDDNARNATKQAANIAGLNVLRLINEPTAAALAYGLSNNLGIYCIYDLGGGTFDISILKFRNGVFQVLATGGDINLGGDDFDQVILEHFNLSDDSILTARAIKEHLTHHDQWTGEINGVNVSISINAFNSLIEQYITKTIDIFKNTIRDAQISIDNIDEVVLVGGSSRINLVKTSITDLIGKAPLDHINCDEIVALGAAVCAHNLTVSSGNLLLDVNPLTLGIELMGGIREAIIPRNTPIPTRVTKTYTTQKDNQRNIKIHIVQGESERIADCRSLASFELNNLPLLNAGEPRIDVTFQIDADGLLTVSALDTKTQTAQKVEVKPAYGLNENDLFDLLKSSETKL